jgi:hypothetical protein
MPSTTAITVPYTHFETWRAFMQVVEALPDIISVGSLWRGQQSDADGLVASIYRDRVAPLAGPELTQDAHDVALHLEAFKTALRGSVGLDYSESDDRWWAIARHAGLRSPLLDWTFSPYVASYFAFRGAREADASRRCAIYRLNWMIVESASQDLVGKTPDLPYSDCLVLLAPKGLDNPPMQAQCGVFTWLYPPQINITEWVKSHCPGEHDMGGGHKDFALSVYTLPNREESRALAALQRMNINAATLFPDARGCAEYANDIMYNLALGHALKVIRGERVPPYHHEQASRHLPPADLTSPPANPRLDS